MIVKTLMENTAENPAFQSEHGLSLYIETGAHKILFDTGQSGAFAANAEKLGVDLSRVEFAVLSHAHYDHSGGIQTFLALNQTAPLYLSRYAFDDYLDGADRFIGLDRTLRDHPQLVSVRENVRLADGLELFTGEGYPYPHPIEAYGLRMRRDGRLLPDDFRHEQYLLVTESGKRVLFSGCSHRGIGNIVRWFRPDVLIGGFHLMKLDPLGAGKAALDAVAAELLACETVYYTCHCTGAPQYAYLKERMKDRLHSLTTGQEITL